MQTYDVIISGAGMVGLTIACGLHGSGLKIAVVEQNEPEKHDKTMAPAIRVSAINAASERLLRHIGVWQDMVSLRVSPYHCMEVRDQDSFAKITFDDRSQGLPHLGHIIENCVIQQALWHKVQSQNDVTLVTPAAFHQVAFGENEAFVTLDNGTMISGRLLIAADGAHSWLRDKADIPLTFWDYQHHALIATIRTELPHQASARQMFHGDGILAFLPLSDPQLCSIVWSVPPLRAQELKEMPAEKFNQQLAMTFDMQAGYCQLEGERQVFPLTARYARQFASHRLALAGDAAHTIHPLAGQGVNLGLMDAAELVGEIKRLSQQGKDIGQHLSLRRYERRRKQSAALMLASMQGFRDLFAGQNPMKKLVRDVGMVLADTLPGVKPQLLKQAMGLYDLPDWLK